MSQEPQRLSTKHWYTFAANLYKLANDVLNSTGSLCYYVNRIAHQGIFSGSGVPSGLNYDAVGWILPILEQRTEELGRAFDRLVGWWVADHPPAVDPESTSVVESIIKNSYEFIHLFRVPGITDHVSSVRYVDLKKKHNEVGVSLYKKFESALSCEVAAILRHPPLRCDNIDLWPEGILENGDYPFGNSFDIKTYLEINITARLPRGWKDLSEQERIKLVEDMWLACPTRDHFRDIDPQDSSGKPVWDQSQKSLVYKGAVLRTYGRGRHAINQWAILQAFQEANWPERIPFPLGIDEPIRGGKELGDALDSLNSGLEVPWIKFKRDGTGQGVAWESLSQAPKIEKNLKTEINGI